MAERSLRGMSIGAKSLESDDNVDFAARNDVAYVCPKGHRTILPFAEGAEIPDEWECRCGSVAHREGDADREGDEISAALISIALIYPLKKLFTLFILLPFF